MAESIHEMQWKTTLILNEDEVDYLSAILQNYPGEDPDEESAGERHMRETLWHALKRRTNGTTI